MFIKIFRIFVLKNFKNIEFLKIWENHTIEFWKFWENYTIEF